MSNSEKKPVEMEALRPFPIMRGQAYCRLKPGDTFFAKPDRVAVLETSGKARKVGKPNKGR